MRKLIMAGLLVGIVVVFAGLVVSGVHKVRQANAKVAIDHNLKWLSEAVSLAHDQNRGLPPAIGTIWNHHGTLHYHLIGFLESRMDLPPPKMSDNFTPFLSGSDPSRPEGFVWQGEYSFTNFPANWLAFTAGPQMNGKTTWEDSFPDGRANTVLFALRYAMCNGTPTLWGYDKMDPKAPFIGYYSTERFQIMPTQAECDPKLANTWFPSMGVAMADGSVRWVGPGVSAATWRSALHPADGVALGSDWGN